MAMLALKPPMGWNSWNTFGGNINERLILETADAMVSEGYRDAGYNILTIDDCWMLKDRDENGNLQFDKAIFPHGMKFIGDYLHERGLKFGIYEDAGTLTCAGRAGSFGYERQDAKLFASWGVDLLKYDFCYSSPGSSDVNLYRRMGQALRESGRDIIFSGCWGDEGVWKWMRSTGAHMWRLTGDIKDSWDSICEVGLGAVGLEAYSGPCGWNDPDMLVVGVDGKGYVGKIGGGSTDDEYQTHFALWCMLNAPLLMGHDLRNARPEIKKILLNKELIDINQDDAAITAYKIPTTRDYFTILAKPLYGGDIVFMIINKNPYWTYYPLSWDYCGWEITDEVSMRDCINHTDLGTFKHGLTVKIEAHSCIVYRATRK
ncbi:MAG: glycoside hydrolase family 27 protein [Eubacteriales bacterium]|nr:glycoside hydrolase family 27 protein [Eubacteriales bacterium]